MRASEAGGREGGGRLQPRDGADSASFKTRRGKVGGYVDYLEPGQREIVDGYIRRHLHPSYGY